MLRYRYIGKIDTQFKYELLEKKEYDLSDNIGKWHMFNPNGDLVVSADEKRLTIMVGYKWDGTTVIGDCYEDEVTLEASMIHDVLYNAKKNPHDIPVPFSLSSADKMMTNFMTYMYKKLDASFYKKYLYPKIFLSGLLSVGLPWKFGNNTYYTIKKLG